MSEARETREFVPLGELAEKSGVPTRTLRRHLRTLDVAIFENPRDRRARLIRAEDAARLQQPRLVRPAGTQLSVA